MAEFLRNSGSGRFRMVSSTVPSSVRPRGYCCSARWRR